MLPINVIYYQIDQGWIVPYHGHVNGPIKRFNIDLNRNECWNFYDAHWMITTPEIDSMQATLEVQYVESWAEPIENSDAE